MLKPLKINLQGLSLLILNIESFPLLRAKLKLYELRVVFTMPATAGSNNLINMEQTQSMALESQHHFMFVNRSGQPLLHSSIVHVYLGIVCP